MSQEEEQYGGDYYNYDNFDKFDHFADVAAELDDYLANYDYDSEHEAIPWKTEMGSNFYFSLGMTAISLACLVLVGILCNGCLRLIFISKAAAILTFNIIRVWK